MIAVVDRIVQYPHRYQLKNVENGQVLGTFDLDPILGTVQVEGTKINKELFDSIAADISARVKLNGGELKDTIVTFEDYAGSENIISGEKASIMMAKIKKKLNDHDNFIATKGKANGLASLDLSGKVVQVANKADADGSGNNIASTYATNTRVGNIENGTTIVEKAKRDSAGNVINETYETKTVVKGVSDRVTNIENGTTVVPKATHSVNSDKAANSDNLGGKPASDYSLKSELTESMKVVRDCKDEIEITNETGCSKDLALPTKESVYELLMINGDTRVHNKNLIDINKLQYGYELAGDGYAIPNENWYVTDYIPVRPNTVYIFKGTSSKWVSMYSRDKVHVSGITGDFNFRTTDGTYFVRINSQISGYRTPILYTIEDNKIVNSHCKLISTGENLINLIDVLRYMKINYTYSPSNNTYICDNIGQGYVEPYKFSEEDIEITISGKTFSNEGTNFRINLLNKNQDIVQTFWASYGSATAKCSYIQFDSSQYKSFRISNLMINYGSTPKSYEPYSEDVIADIGELTKYDSIDNVDKKLYIKSNKVIYDGSPDEDWRLSDYPNSISIGIGGDIALDGECNIYKNFISSEEIGTKDGIYLIYTGSIIITDSRFTSLDAAKNIMKNHPIEVVYEKLDLTVIDMSSNPLPYTQKITKGGMQLQESINGGLPYNLTKVYAINIQAQVDANASANSRQNDEIYALENRAKALENGKVDKEDSHYLINSKNIADGDLDNYHETGFYYFTTGNKHTPDGGSWYKVLVVGNPYEDSTADCFQIAVSVTNEKTYCRPYAGHWREWKEISNDSIKKYIDDELAKKQNSTDNSLETTAKTVVSAINELNTNKANNSTTLAGYGITDALGKTDTAADSDKLGGLSSSVYAKTEVYNDLSINIETNQGSITDLGDTFITHSNPKIFMLTFAISFMGGIIAIRETKTFLNPRETFIFSDTHQVYAIDFKISYNPGDDMLSLEIEKIGGRFDSITVTDIAVIY